MTFYETVYIKFTRIIGTTPGRDIALTLRPVSGSTKERELKTLKA